MTRTITSKYFIELLDMKHEKSFRLKKDEMHPDDPMYAYVMKHKRVETKKVYSKAIKSIVKILDRKCLTEG